MLPQNRNRERRVRPHLWLIAVIGWIVPRRLRSDWQQEWEAELRCRAALLADWGKLNWRSKLDLLRRSVGAFWDALSLAPRRLEDDLFQDLRYAARMLRRKPIFTATAVLTLSLGIGANTAVFSVINGVLLRPLPYPQPEQLVRVWGINQQIGNTRGKASSPNLADWRAQNTVFESLGAYAENRWMLTRQAEPEKIAVVQTTEGFFSVLGLRAALGRFFLPPEYVSGQHQVAVLSDWFWQRRFGADPKVIGQSLTLEDQSYTIIGVLSPNDLQFPSPSAALWVPLPPDPARGSRYLDTIARLKPSVTLEQAQSEMSAIAGRLEKEHPESNTGIGVRLEPLQEAIVGDSRKLLLILLSITGCVLLIACANVANLLLFRLNERQKELTIRAAVGATHLRIIRQLMTESVLLALCGGAAGLVLARGTTTLLLSVSPQEIPRQNEIGMDSTVFAFALVISVLPGLVIGLLAALQASRPALAQRLKESGQRTAVNHRRHWLRHGLVIAEVALSLVLAIGAGLLNKSLWLLQEVNPGFRSEHLLTFNLTLPDSRYPDTPRTLDFYARLTERLSALPGVQSVATVSMLPLSGDRLCNEVTIPGLSAESPPCVEHHSITPDYLRTMSIALLSGRQFSERDNQAAPRVAMINQTMARLLGPGEAIGKRFSFRGAEREVVGVVADVKHFRLNTDVRPEAYLPLKQAPLPFASVVLRASSEPAALAAAARQAVWSVDRDLPISNLKTMEQVVADSIAEPRFRALLVNAFSALALLLTIVGLYGVIAYSVNQRVPEIGLRMALGAQSQDMLRLVLGQGLKLTLTGIAIGLLGAWGLTRVLSSFLFSVSVTDPPTFVLMSALLIVTALLACYLPARRATQVDPMIALRCE